jgi:hypothetical protein
VASTAAKARGPGWLLTSGSGKDCAF